MSPQNSTAKAIVAATSRRDVASVSNAAATMPVTR